MKRLLPLAFLALLACNLPLMGSKDPTPAVVPTFTATAALPVATLGTDNDPMILALGPSLQPKAEVLAAGKTLTALLEKATGYKFVSVVPPDETELIKAFGMKDANIGVLSPAGYLLASGQGFVEAAFARQLGGKSFYGAQFIARSDAEYTSYYDPIKDENSAEAPVALAQFNKKKPCWTDQYSPSGYIVPLGFLGNAGVKTQAPAFLAGHPAVVRAIYAGGICDFGATFIDARAYPGLEDQYPDVMKKVFVVWRMPPIIPYDSMVFMHGMNEDQRRVLLRAFADIMATPDGKTAIQTLYGFDAMQVVQDSQYDDFRKAVKASGLDLSTLLK